MDPVVGADSGDVVLADLALEKLAGVLALADAYLGNDSGVTHLAAAVRYGSPRRPTPTVALFGPSDPRVWGPRGRHVVIIRSPDGRMEGITTERVRAAIEESAPDASTGGKLSPRGAWGFAY